MRKQVRGRLLPTLGAVWVLCLVSQGCRVEVAYSILGIKAPPKSPAAATKQAGPAAPADPAAGGGNDHGSSPAVQTLQQPLQVPPAGGSNESDPSPVVQTSYQAVARPDDQASTATPARVSELPRLRPTEGGLYMASSSDKYTGNGAAPTAKLAAETKPGAGPPQVLPPLVPQAGPGCNGPACNGPGGKGACGNGGPGAGGPEGPYAGDMGLPTELAPVSHPPYMIEPPDILLVDAIRMVPRGPYTVQPLDVLLIRVVGTLANQPIEGAYTITPDGMINLGYTYGSVRVAGMTLEAVQEAIRRQLIAGPGRLTAPQVAVGLGQFRGIQQVRGEHLVRQDGTISLGTYGCVYVTGLTIPQAKHAIEMHLSQFLVDPVISLDVFAYNSKVYYIILDGGGFGQQVFRFPITGKETVLDAISHIQGLPTVASRRRIWVARPGPADNPCSQILPVDWRAITMGGSTGTNWQLFPGDRLYVAADPLIALDNWIYKITAPIQRILGVTLLGAEVKQAFRSNNNGSNSATPFLFVP